jgi:hypothetical protein
MIKRSIKESEIRQEDHDKQYGMWYRAQKKKTCVKKSSKKGAVIKMLKAVIVTEAVIVTKTVI